MMVQTFKVWRRNEFKLLYDPESLIRCFTLLSKENLNLLMVSSPSLILSSPLLRVRTAISK